MSEERQIIAGVIAAGGLVYLISMAIDEWRPPASPTLPTNPADIPVEK